MEGRLLVEMILSPHGPLRCSKATYSTIIIMYSMRDVFRRKFFNRLYSFKFLYLICHNFWTSKHIYLVSQCDRQQAPIFFDQINFSEQKFVGLPFVSSVCNSQSKYSAETGLALLLTPEVV